MYCRLNLMAEGFRQLSLSRLRGGDQGWGVYYGQKAMADQPYLEGNHWHLEGIR